MFINTTLSRVQYSKVSDRIQSPTAPNSSYEEIDLNVVVVEYSGPQLINSSLPLQFRYAGNPDINDIRPKRIRNRFVYFML